MKRKIMVISLALIMCFTLAGCGSNGKAKDESKLNDTYNKVSEYFGDEKADRSNLGAYYLDTEKNVVIVVLVDNSKDKQDDFKKLVKVDSKYLEFVQGGPYSSSSKN